MSEKLKPLILGDLEIKVPIIQGGMGVRVSVAPLVAAVANCGGGGTIASVGLPPDTEENRKDVPKSCREHLIKEIREARKLSNGVIGVNIMVALSNYEDMAKTAIEEKVDYIISGAGLPLSLPELAKGSSTKLIPMVASARGAKVLINTWKRRYNRFPDAFVIEGALSGGHIAGYSLDELNSLKDRFESEPFLENSVKELLDLVKEYEDKYAVKMPIIVAGGIFDGKDIAKFLKMGASGVQMGTRFVTTDECSVAKEFKEAYIKAKKEDIVFVQSPVGMPAKAIKTKFLENVLKGERKKFVCNYRCLKTCNPATVKFCIAKALINAANGDIDNAVLFAGTNVYKIKEIVSVKELMDELVSETVEELNKEMV